MTIKQGDVGMLDVVILKDGRLGTIVESYDNGLAFIVEISPKPDDFDEWLPIVKLEDIKEITHKANTIK